MDSNHFQHKRELFVGVFFIFLGLLFFSFFFFLKNEKKQNKSQSKENNIYKFINENLTRLNLKNENRKNFEYLNQKKIEPLSESLNESQYKESYVQELESLNNGAFFEKIKDKMGPNLKEWDETIEGRQFLNQALDEEEKEIEDLKKQQFIKKIKEEARRQGVQLTVDSRGHILKAEPLNEQGALLLESSQRAKGRGGSGK